MAYMDYMDLDVCHTRNAVKSLTHWAFWLHLNGLVEERRNSIVNALELHLSCRVGVSTRDMSMSTSTLLSMSTSTQYAKMCEYELRVL